MDIPSNDILVGRDQGLSPYHIYLEKFFGIKVNTWEDLSVTISKEVRDHIRRESRRDNCSTALMSGSYYSNWRTKIGDKKWFQNINKLKTIYAGVQDLDVFVGLSLETRDYDNYKYVGPVGKHILGEQFNRSKFGDRFFYCLKNQANPFTLSNCPTRLLISINFTELFIFKVN